MNKQAKIAFIGGGNMATAIISGLIDSGYKPENILASAPSKATRHKLAADFNIVIGSGLFIFSMARLNSEQVKGE